MMGRSVEWSRVERLDGDPYWQVAVGPLLLQVDVKCEWVFGWVVHLPHAEADLDMAAGSVYTGDPEGEEEKWDYQGVERAQARCLAVATGLLLQMVREAWSNPGLIAEYYVDPFSEENADRDFSRWTAEWTVLVEEPDGLRTFKGVTETEALVAALENAP